MSMISKLSEYKTDHFPESNCGRQKMDDEQVWP